MTARPFALSAALTCSLLASSARGEVVVYTNDSVGPNGPISCEDNSPYFEVGAAVFHVPQADGPIALLEAQYFTCDESGSGRAQDVLARVAVYGPDFPNSSLVHLMTDVASPGVLNKALLPPGLVILDGSSFTISVNLESSSYFQGLTSLATDTNGCEAGKNLKFVGSLAGWIDLCALGFPGDYVIRARVLTQGPKPYGSGLAGAAGVPQISWDGLWSLGSSISVDCSSVAPGLPGVLVLAGAPASIPLFGGTLLVDLAAPTIFPLLSTSVGSASKSVAIPTQPAIAGLHAYFQFGFLDSAAPQGFALSNGLDVRVSPN
jgi:hypothetical protein